MDQKNTKFIIIVVVVLVIAVVAIISLNDDNKSKKSEAVGNLTSVNTTNSPSSNTENIDIKNMEFSEKVITVKAGTTIKWTNNDSMLHTVTSKTDAFSSGNLNKGETFEFTFVEKGEFAYFCEFHPEMGGKIIVE